MGVLWFGGWGVRVRGGRACAAERLGQNVPRPKVRLVWIYFFESVCLCAGTFVGGWPVSFVEYLDKEFCKSIQ